MNNRKQKGNCNRNGKGCSNNNKKASCNKNIKKGNGTCKRDGSCKNPNS